MITRASPRASGQSMQSAHQRGGTNFRASAAKRRHRSVTAAGRKLLQQSDTGAAGGRGAPRRPRHPLTHPPTMGAPPPGSHPNGPKAGHARCVAGSALIDPGRLVDIGRQTRKHHRAGGQRQHRRHQANGRWDRPGRTGDYHRVGGRLPAQASAWRASTWLRQPLAETAGGGQNRRPVGGENFQEAQCHLPMIGQFIGHQGFNRRNQAFGMDLIDQLASAWARRRAVECYRRGGGPGRPISTIKRASRNWRCKTPIGRSRHRRSASV